MAETRTDYPELPPLEQVEILGKIIDIPTGSIINLHASKLKIGHRCTVKSDFAAGELLNSRIPKSGDKHLYSQDHKPIYQTTSTSFRYGFIADAGGRDNARKEEVIRTAASGSRFTIVKLAEPKPRELEQTKMF